MLARHGRRLLNLLDDTPIVPGDTRPAFEHADQARQVLNDAEEDLREWQPNIEPIHSSATGMGSNLMPAGGSTVAPSVADEGSTMMRDDTSSQGRIAGGEGHQFQQAQLDAPQHGEAGEISFADSQYAQSERA